MKRLNVLVIILMCMFFAGCHASIDVDLAYESIKDEDGKQKSNAIEVLTEKFGEPHAPSSTQLGKMKEQEASIRGSRAKTDFSDFKVWGSNSKFIALSPPGKGNRVVVFGRKSRPPERK